MTQRNDDPPATPRQTPSWVDEVLRADREAAPHPQPAPDLRIPEAPRPQPVPVQSPEVLEDEWRLREPGAPQVQPEPRVTYATPSDWPVVAPGTPVRPVPTTGLPADIAQKKLIAGLLALFFGSLGVHKFYLGLNTPGLITLGAHIGVWVLALFLGLLTFGIGMIVLVPLAMLVGSVLGLIGLIEGILYLTKSDEDFYRQYVLEGRAFL